MNYFSRIAVVIVVIGMIATALLMLGSMDDIQQEKGFQDERYFEYLGDGFVAISPIPQRVDLDQRKVALGEKLFNDPIMSGGRASCATCHSLERAGVDGLETSINIQGGFDVLNTPTVFNAGFNQFQGWDGELPSLESQIDDVLNNPRHLDSNWPELIVRLQKSPDYRKLFRALFHDAVTKKNIQEVLAVFERSLITPDSAFDRFLRGEETALSEDQKSGYRLFREYGCISCHQGINVGGNLKARLGLFNRHAAPKGDDMDDLPRPSWVNRIFRVPSLRNVEKTAPYFHDGSVANLDQAVAAMGWYQLGRKIPEADRYLIVAFLKSLTGKYRGKPL